MQAGHTLTIEPMINEGTDRSVIWPDKWTVTSSDGRRSSQFEHTLLITPTGVEPSRRCRRRRPSSAPRNDRGLAGE